MRLNCPVITILQYTVGQGSVAQMVLKGEKFRFVACSALEKHQKLEEVKCTNV